MRRFLSRWWPGTCLLVPLLTCGCQHNRCCCSPCTPSAGMGMGAPITAPSSTAPAAEALAPTDGTIQPAVNTLPPVTHIAAKAAVPSSTDPLLTQAPPPHPSVTAQSAAPSSLPASDPDERAEARPHFAHDPNYRWLVGSLDYSRIQQAWLLRYVPIDQEDRYGGCVTLVLSSRGMNFKPGQIVRVEGGLIDPDSQQMRPAFEVQKIRAE